MSKKTVRCYVSKIKNEKGVKIDIKNLEKIIEKIFELPEAKETDEENRCLIYSENDENNYLSLEYIKKVNNNIVDNNYMLFRIGRQKDIEGALKRNVNTFEGKEVIDKDEQNVYNLEICTYLIIDKEKGVICELFGNYAPTVKSFIYILNKCIEKLEANYKKYIISYANIMTDKMIKTYADNADKLGKIIYQFEKPNVDFLKMFDLTEAQIIALEDLDVFEVEVALKGKTRIPLSSNGLIIKNIIDNLYKLPKKIKDKVKIIGKTSKSNTKAYTFNEENVTYYIDIPYTKTEDGAIKKLTLNEISEEVYKKILDLYENNRNDLYSYIE